jgi:hypothetical protein
LGGVGGGGEEEEKEDEEAAEGKHCESFPIE